MDSENVVVTIMSSWAHSSPTMPMPLLCRSYKTSYHPLKKQPCEDYVVAAVTRQGPAAPLHRTHGILQCSKYPRIDLLVIGG